MDPISSLVYSSLSGLVARTLTHPLDTIKTLAQATDGKTNLSNIAINAIKTNNGSPTVFFRGLGVTLLFSVPATGMYLTTYDVVKQMFVRQDSIWVQVVAGMSAEVVSGVLWAPMENLKCKLQAGTDANGQRTTATAIPPQRSPQRSTSTSTPHTQSTIALARDIYRTHGIRGFFRGYLLTQFVFVPYTVVYFVTYERFKLGWAWAFGRHQQHIDTATQQTLSSSSQVTKSDTPTHLSSTGYLICASASGAIAGAVSNIFDVVKTRVQVASTTSTWETIRWLWVHERGPLAFTKGMLARILWVTPSMAISVSVFELLKDAHMRRFGDKEVVQ